ncbi:MAG: TlpA family protein disulfide reductase [Bdellovibrionales bacterium]|nr:TlpA family protein disulfide reductase [Bdellovibrionales bacterium]
MQWTNESKANRDSKELMATQGDLLSLDQFKGQFTLINFWASWCEACALESPLLRELWEVYGTKGRLAMIGVASFDKWSDLRISSKLLAKDYPVAFDDKGRVALKYGVTVLPVSVLINPQGLILATFPGVLNQEKLRVIKSQIP